MKIFDKIKSFFTKIKTWLADNHVKKIGNLAVMTVFLILHEAFIAGIFFGFFLINNKEFLNSLYEKFIALFKKKEA
jgi:hypothetical protein